MRRTEGNSIFEVPTPELVADRGVPESVGGWMFDQAIWRSGHHAGVISTRGFVLLLQEDNHDQAELSQKVQTLHTPCCNPLGSTLRIESGYHCISPSTGKCVENVGTRSIEFRGFRNFGRRDRGGSLHCVFLQTLRSGLRKSYQSEGRGGWINDSDLAFPEAAPRPAILPHHRLEYPRRHRSHALGCWLRSWHDILLGSTPDSVWKDQ